MSENQFISSESKEEALGRMGSEDEIARRDRGELLDQFSMYDFHPMINLLEKIHPEEPRGSEDDPRYRLRKILTSHGRFPRDWTRYLSIDPSHTRTACHSWVVPPPHEFEGVHYGPLAICEWELIVKKHSAHMLAEELYTLMAGMPYEAFIMDKRAGRQTSIGRGENTFEAYANAFASKKLYSRLTHSGFVPGVDVPSTRYRAVRDCLTVGQFGLPKFLFVADKCWETRREFGNYRKKIVNAVGDEVLMDEPANPRLFDAMASVEYFAAYIVPQFALGQAYVEPSIYGGKESPALRRAREILARDKNRNPDYVHLGPGAAA
jgi:hypothetical protein